MNKFDLLRPYQREDVAFLSRLSSGLLLNEQRTGKTPTVLAVAKEHGCKKILVVCPSSAVFQWADEFTTWTGEPCLACVGTPKKRKDIITSWTNGLVIGYDTLKEIARFNKSTETIVVGGELGNILSAHPEMVILDEAHRLRNPKTAVAKAAFKLSDITYRYALTGTAAINRAEEIWSILHFLYPASFKSYWKFVNEYFRTEKKRNISGQTYVDIGILTPQGKRVLLYVLSKIAVNRKRKDIMEWLPEKKHILIKLPLTKEQRRYLDELEEIFETEHVVTKGILDRIIRYRQICLDPKLLELPSVSPKTDWLLQYIRDYPERSILVFSKFTSYLRSLAERIPGCEMIIGDTPLVRRRDICKAFQEGKISVLLLNLDAGKEGLTLDSGEAVVFMDKFPPVGDLMQAEDRFVATTPDKAGKLHLVYNLVMRDSYEEDIQQMIADRLSETDIINNFKQHLERRKNHGIHSEIPGRRAKAV